MEIRKFFFVFILIWCSVFTMGETGRLWNKVSQARREGLPRTAIEYLDEIIEISTAKGLDIDWLRAVTEKIVLESNIQGNKPVEKIILMKREIDNSKRPLNTMLRIVLARWYWHYYNQNRWRIMRRTRTADMDNDDIETWDLFKIYTEIDTLYQDILKDEDYLKTIPIDNFKGFLSMGTADPALRPALFDFVVWEAIRFYSYPEFHAALPVGAYEIDSESAAFSCYNEFIKYTPDTCDIDSPKYKSIRLYQSLIKHHIALKNVPALIDADIHRLIYVKNHAFGLDIEDKFIENLKKTIKEFSKYDLISKAYYHIALAYRDKDELQKAVQYAEKGHVEFEGTLYSHNCNALLNDIKSRSLNIVSEFSIPEGKSNILVQYKNFERLHIRIYERDWQGILNTVSPSIFSLRRNELPDILMRTPIYSYSLDLERTEDFKINTIEAEIPSLRAGLYWIIASYDENFSRSTHVQANSLWVSNITLVNKTESEKIDGFVLNTVTGLPVDGADIDIYIFNRYRRLEKVDSTKSNAEGYFIFDSVDLHRNFHIFIKKGRQQLFTQNQYVHRHQEYRPSQRTLLFTDRAIYRPGQTIYFKGICIDIDHDQGSYTTVPKRQVNVGFYDPNGKEIHSLSLRTNDFGSFSGNFNAPSDRLLGAMSIRVDFPRGQTTVRVEEYKRPRFYVEFEDIEEAYSINDDITVTGIALAYNGSPVDNAQVRYRVVRQANYPGWWSFYWPVPRTPSQEIKNGTTVTDASGRYYIDFIAIPDQKTQYDPNIFYRYTIYADVTDLAGETRSSSKSVNIGNRSITLTLSAEGNIVEDRSFGLNLSSRNLNGQFYPSHGTIKIHKLSEPSKPIRSDLWDRPGNREFCSNWMKWEIETQVKEIIFNTDTANPFKIELSLPVGLYKIEAMGKDTNDKEINAFLPLIVGPDKNRRHFPIKMPFYVYQPGSIARVGETYSMLWGTGYKDARAYISISYRDHIVKSGWTPANLTLHEISVEVTEEMRGGFWITIYFVRENRNYTGSYFVNVPWDNKDIDIAFESFRDTLLPGEEETWRLTLKAPSGDLDGAEMVATLYDSSLDAFIKHIFPSFNFFRSHSRHFNIFFPNRSQTFRTLINNWNIYMSQRGMVYASLPDSVITQFYYYDMYHRARFSTEVAAAPTVEANAESGMVLAEDAQMVDAAEMKAPVVPPSPPAEDIDISIRTDLRETSFFYPHLIMNDDGSITIEFKIGESLTKWRFLGFAHNQQCMHGSIESFVTTKKNIMIQPNSPRFLRENDLIEFTATVINTTDDRMSGKASIDLLDYITGDCIKTDILLSDASQDFILEGNSSTAISWKLRVPENCPPVEFTVSAVSGRHTDGERGIIPVLPSRIFVTESIPIHVREKETKEFLLESLFELEKRPTLKPFRLTVEMSSNPIWYAIQALPFLIDYPYQCSEQVFNRIYANYISRHIITSNPGIKRTIEQWKQNPDSLKSNLEKNQELKSVMLEETPWLVAAKNETEAKRNLSIYFDENYINDLHKRSMEQLKNMQLPGGGFPWFPGGRENPFITMYIIGGFGKLASVGMDYDPDIISGGIACMDNWLLRYYNHLVNRNANNLNSIVALYLYARSFFVYDYPVPESIKGPFDYFINQASEYWLTLNSRMNQAQIALALHRLHDKNVPLRIMASIKERSVYDDELGMFWREDELQIWWYRAPIETQAIMIEAFDEIMDDKESVENCKVWLLKQKQTTHWRTTKATADAIYALIFIGDDWLDSSEITQTALGPMNITPDPGSVEPGTGYYKVIIPADEIKPYHSRITVQREDKGISWGGVYFQYFEDMSQIRPHKTNLIVEKDLFIESYTDKGPMISPLSNPISVGDTVVVRIKLKTDRDMEFVHLKDYRGSGFEPIDVLSLYRYQDGLIFYQTTRDSATHFFIDYMPKGTYIFEYKLQTRHRGSYQSGIAEISCMYAPEFSSHSESILIEVE